MNHQRGIKFVMFILLACMLFACKSQQRNFGSDSMPTLTPSSSPVSTPTPSPVSIPTPTPSSETVNEGKDVEYCYIIDFPDGEAQIGDLYPEIVSKLEVHYSDMSGEYLVTIEDEEKIQKFLSLIADIEIVNEFDPIFGAGGHNISARLYAGNELVITLTEDSSYMTFDVVHYDRSKSYAIKDLELREDTVMLQALNDVIAEHQLGLKNEDSIIYFIPLLVEGDGFSISGETSLYAMPAEYGLETIDFSDYILSIDGEVITELPTESGEYILVVDNGIGLYQIKFFVGE